VQLFSGSRVAIVGGGPAGSFAALHLLRLAKQTGRRFEVIIFEARDFNRPGPGGCNRCAGILSSPLVHNLGRLGLSLPADVIQSELHAYILHLGATQLPVRQAESDRGIYSIYRGSGPRIGGEPRPHSFDGWLLDQAVARGASLRRARVRTVQMGARPLVVAARDSIDADLVVIATGVNSQAPLERAWGYRPPGTETMAQDEVSLPPGLLDESVHVFFDHPPGLIFAGVIPKGRYANLSLLGRGLPPDAIGEFLEGTGAARLLQHNGVSLCGCTPRVAVTPARRYYADRMVVIGDAAITRLYKDGIGSAFVTAEAACRAAVEHGVSRRDFARAYRPVCNRIAVDNAYGRLLIRAWAATRRLPRLLEVWQRAVLAEAALPPAARVHTRVLWGMFTGDEPYRRLFWLAFSPLALRRLWHGARRDRQAQVTDGAA
jgi:flavin-dependent dehydrogenase